MPFEGYLQRYSRPLLGFFALLVFLLLPGLFLLRSNNSPQVFFVEDLEQLKHYQELRRHFGSDEVLRVVVQGEGLWTEEGLRWLGEVEEQSGVLAGVVWAGGLAGHHRERGWPPKDPTVFRSQVTENELDRGLGMVSADGETVTVLVALEDGSGAASYPTVEALSQLLIEVPPGIDARLVGLPILNHALDQSAQEIGQRFFPLLVLFAVVLLGLGLRHPAGVLPPLLFVGFCELGVLAPMGYAGVELNLVLAVLPPLLFVISLATALHVLLHFRIQAGNQEDPAKACAATYQEKGWSVMWTGLSTVLGFASLALSPVPPVRNLGLLAAAGLVLMTVAAFVLFPALLVVWPPPQALDLEHRFRRFGAALGHQACRQRRLILLIAVAVAAFALIGTTRIRVETNALRYLSPEHPVRVQMEALEAEGIGLATLEVLIRLPAGFRNGLEVERLTAFTDRLEGESLVLGAVSAGSLMRDALRRVPMLPFIEPAAHRAAVWRALEGDPKGAEMIRGLLTDDRQLARVTLFVPTKGFDELDPVFVTARQVAAELFPEAKVEVTGQYPLLLEAQRHLLYTLGVSFGFTLVGVFLILRFLLPGTRLAFLALLPNLWPVLGVLGFMGWAGVPLDIATVMVASVVLGLAVDDTLHTLGHFRCLAPGRSASRAVIRTLSLTAPAYLLTGVILVAGFGVCALSDFAPTARFGYLASFAIVLAVLGDLFLLPALLSLTPRSTLTRWASPHRRKKNAP